MPSSQDLPRVAMVLMYDLVGGSEIAMLRLAVALRSRGHYSPVGFVRHIDGPIGRMMQGEGLPLVEYPCSFPSYLHPVPYWRDIFTLRRLLRKNQIRVLHCADMPVAQHAPLAGKLAGVPSVCHIRSNFGNPLTRYKLPLACVDHFAFASRSTRENFRQIWKVSPYRADIIYDWPPARTPARDRESVRAELGIPAGAFVVGMVARIAFPKDHQTLVKAWSQLARADANLWLLLVGEPKTSQDDDELCKAVRDSGFQDRILVTGHREDIPDLMAAMDVHVLCTRSEGFGLVLLEAMSVGVPVIGTQVGGVPEIVEHNRTGLLHACGDADDLAAQIGSLRADPDLGRRLAAAAKVRLATEFSASRAAMQVEEIYRRLCGRQAA
jgi:glycosyltransferase involved in cell wall biosynthesis